MGEDFIHPSASMDDFQGPAEMATELEGATIEIRELIDALRNEPAEAVHMGTVQERQTAWAYLFAAQSIFVCRFTDHIRGESDPEDGKVTCTLDVYAQELARCVDHDDAGRRAEMIDFVNGTLGRFGLELRAKETAE
jgi:hypothetical protein